MLLIGFLLGSAATILCYCIWIGLTDYRYRKARPAPIPLSSIRHLTSECEQEDETYYPRTLNDPLLKGL